MNPDLALLHPYPFEQLRSLFSRPEPAPAADRPAREIRLSIGEPQHPTPELVKTALATHLDGLASYPTTQGGEALRSAIAQWLQRRYALPGVDATRHILPVNGSREALFSFTQAVIDRRQGARVLCPNPFYQIYEGAALLAGAQPLYLNTLPENDYVPDWASLDEATWRTVQLVFVCSPGNPTGKVLSLAQWQHLFDLAERHDFVIAADECYSEIYPDETHPPLGALAAAHALGRDDFARLLVFSSLSKRSNVPGMRSGFVAGDARLIADFLRYRTYHGSAMNPAIQAASIAAWNDEAHVAENRRRYAQKFAAVTPLLAAHLPCVPPDAGFYLWADCAQSGLSDEAFALALHRAHNVIVLPGSYLARCADGINPGANRVRIALVADLDDCVEAAGRIVRFCRSL